MKRLPILIALLPFAALAQPINTLNNPNQQGYVIPSQQRMQTEMMSQQQQQKGMLNQQLKTQTQVQQQYLQNQMNANTQRVQQGQMREQPLSNSNGGMLGGGVSQSSGICCRPSRTAVCLINKVRPDLVNRIGTDAVHAPAQQLGCTLGFVDGVDQDMQTGLFQQRHARFIQQLMVEVDRHAT